MAVLIINDNERRIEYTAASLETNFTYPFEIFQDGDLDVYQNEVKLVLTTDYTVTNAGVTGGGDVILVVPATLDDEIVIDGSLIIEQKVDFTIKANFTGNTIQIQMDRLTIFAQEIDTKLKQRALLYNVFENLKPDNQDNILPQLAANQIWQMNSTGNGIFAAELEVDPGANTLRAELISNQSGSDGAKIVGYFSPTLGGTFVNNYLVRTESKTNGSDGASVIGYYDASDNTEKTVKIKLDEFASNAVFKNIIIGGDFTTNPVQRGAAFDPVADGTFVADRFRNNQIGSMVLKTSIETTSPPPVALAGIFVNKFLRYEVTTPAATGVGDFTFLSQSIEGFDWTRIAQRKFNVSFLVRSNITGTFALALKNLDSTLSYVTNFTIDVANTWEKKDINIAASPAAGNWNYENGIGLEFVITLGSGTTFQTTTLDSWETGNFIASSTQTNLMGTINNTFDLALIQVEEGEQATAFEVRHFEQELALCQRYFVKTYLLGTLPGTATGDGQLRSLVQAAGLSAQATRMSFVFPVRIRKKPLISEIVIFSSGTGDTGKIFDSSSGLDKNAVVPSEIGGDLNVYIETATGGFSPGSDLAAQVTVDVEL